MPRMPKPVTDRLTVRTSALPETFRPGGVAEVAFALQVSRSQVTTWVGRRASNCCPPPLWSLRQGSTYAIDEWDRWRAGERFAADAHADLSYLSEPGAVER